jgi:hypothetical protein
MAAASTSTRSRYKGPLEPIIAAISKVATKPNFLQYTETLTGPVERVKIEKVAEMWGPIHAVWPQLTFNQKDVEDCMNKVGHKRSSDWHVDPENTTEEMIATWAVACAKMFRAMARHLRQGIDARKGWAMTVVKVVQEPVDAGDGDEAGGEGGEEEVPKVTDEVDDDDQDL